MNDMEKGIIPGMELPNGKCEPNYPQEFVYGEYRNAKYPTNNVAKAVPASKDEIMRITRGK